MSGLYPSKGIYEPGFDACSKTMSLKPFKLIVHSSANIAISTWP